MPQSASNQELISKIKAWQTTKDPALAQDILTNLKPIIDSALTTFGIHSPTLRSKAKVLILQVLPKFDPQKAALNTFLYSHLQGLKRLSASELSPVHIPERLIILKQKINRFVQEFSTTNGREPTPNEISSTLKIPVATVKKLINLQLPKPSSIAFSGDEGEEVAAGNISAINAELRDYQRQKWLEFIYHDLSDREKLIVDYLYGLNNRPKLSKLEIAKRLKISPSMVSHIVNRVQKLIDLRESLTSEIGFN